MRGITVTLATGRMPSRTLPFALGDAPEEIVSAARRKLRATAATGGAIAERVEELVGSTGDSP